MTNEKETPSIELKEYLDKAVSYNKALTPLLRAKYPDKQTIRDILQKLANELGYDLIDLDTGTVEPKLN